MIDLNNILLYEQNPEALQAVQSGEAKISTGGIRRLDGTYLDQAKPASMSVADLLSLIEGKVHTHFTDEQLRNLDSRLYLSSEGFKQIQEIGWLNNATIQMTYTMTYDGFKQTLLGLENVATGINELSQYIRQRDIMDTLEKVQLYLNNMKSDEGKMRLSRFDALNSNVVEHIDQISAFIKRLLDDVLKGTDDSYISLKILVNLLSPFSFIVRKFSALYYYENKILPGNYDEWVNSVSLVAKSSEFRNRLVYYINLKTIIPYRDRMLVSREITSGVRGLLSGVEFDRRYILMHSKEDYMSLPAKIQKKIETQDYILDDGNMCIFL